MSVKPVRSVRISGFAAALCAWAALCASAARADMYVASGNANAAAPYDTWAHAAPDIATAVAAATDGTTIHVKEGLYPIAAPIVVTNAIQILGEDPDPSRVVVSNTADANQYDQHLRIFRIDHAEALVANLTMQKGQEYGDGGNLYIGAGGGTVSNCVVEAGYTRDNGKAGGAWLEAGVVTHTVFRKNNTSSATVWWNGVTEGVLHLGGSSRAENCLFDDNPQRVAVTLVSVAQSAIFRNCTIINSCLSQTNDYCKSWSALKIDSGATVQNVAIAGVTNAVDGAACPPTGTVDNFRNGAFDGDVTGLPTATVSGTAAKFFKDYAHGDYTPKSGGLLVNKGAMYAGMASRDLAGRARKIGRSVDIGCYEGNVAGTVLRMR